MSQTNFQKIRASYDLTNDPVPIPFGDDVLIPLRRAEYRDQQNGHQPYVEHMEKFFKNFTQTSRRRREPTKKEREDAMREGFVKYLFEEEGSGVTRDEFKALLYDNEHPEFFDDVFTVVNGSRFYQVEREAGAEATAANAGNSRPA